MVKIFTSLFVVVVALLAEPSVFGTKAVTTVPYENEVIQTQSPLMKKIQSFVGEEVFLKNRDFIKIIFSPEHDFYVQERVDIVKVIQTLKENGLLNLFFNSPKELKLSFTTSGSPLFFVKIMGDALRNIGYYRYVTDESTLDASEFTWTIGLSAEYATDPLILEEELKKSGCGIIDVVRISATEWEYSINMSEAFLHIPSLVSGEEFHLKRSLYAHWLNVQNIQTLAIKSSFRDDWYPHITYYDKELHLLEVIKKDKKTRNISFTIPKRAKYIKITDIYTLKNVKDNLILMPTGSR